MCLGGSRSLSARSTLGGSTTRHGRPLARTRAVEWTVSSEIGARAQRLMTSSGARPPLGTGPVLTSKSLQAARTQYSPRSSPRNS